MDLSKIVAIEKEIDITHPVSGEPIGLRIKLLPGSTKQVEKVRREIANERISKGDKKFTADDLENGAYRIVIASVSDWEWLGDTTFKGEKPECTAANVRKVLDALPWMKDQIDRAISDTASFFSQ